MSIRGIKKHLPWIIPLVIADIILFGMLYRCTRKPAAIPGPELVLHTEEEQTKPSFCHDVGYPTLQTNLVNTQQTGVYQPTASGRISSALYGSVRTAKRGGRLRPTFHEGIDIAAMERDRKSRPLDEIFAVADGKVGYINRVAGNSSYGRYIVLIHEDPLGPVYTLYSHLAKVTPLLNEGQKVKKGDVLGIMGNSSTLGIPMSRAHLHFEIGLILNNRFPAWYKAKKLTPDHGRYHGWNLLGMNPLEFYRLQYEFPSFTFGAHIAAIPPAIEFVGRTKKRPDFFRRYPTLWKDAPYKGGDIVVLLSENGVPLSGRNAHPDESSKLSKREQWAVLNVHPEILGRNGTRLVSRSGGAWKLAREGKKRLEILAY